MRTILVIILAIFTNDPKEIAKINALKKEAEAAYLSEDYELALSKYTLLNDSLGVDDPAIRLNLAHSHYHLGDTAGAKLNYSKLTGSESKTLKSIALQQLGVMSKDAGKLKEALNQLKSAIKSDPMNQGARYNYEVVKKLLENKQNSGDGDDKDKVEPSEYAKSMKERSDNFRYKGQWQSAYDTMLESYSNDKTTEAYEDYIKKLQKVLIGEK